jgi:hypothetical protein
MTTENNELLLELRDVSITFCSKAPRSLSE